MMISHFFLTFAILRKRSWFAMPPKRKATCPPTGGKLIKTKSPVNKDSIPALVKDDDFEKPSSGKNLDNNKLDKKRLLLFYCKTHTS